MTNLNVPGLGTFDDIGAYMHGVGEAARAAARTVARADTAAKNRALASIAAALTRDEARLLYSMGWETANMHFATPQAIAQVKHDLASRRGRWLHKAAKTMRAATKRDWKKWQHDWKRSASR